MPVDGQPKLGHKCCGCCCDTKRAVIIIQLIFGIVLNCVGIALSLFAVGIRVDDDPQLEEDLKKAGKTNAIINGVGIAIAVIVIFGANMYNIYLVLLGILWTITQTVVNILLTYQAYQDSSNNSYPVVSAIIPIIVSLMLIYPHAVFIFEVHSGVMSVETYAAREEQSCCCV